jgi:hypothetical protein
MKRWTTVVVVLLVICGIGLRHYTHRAAAQTNAGWTTLFDGKTINDWAPVRDGGN